MHEEILFGIQRIVSEFCDEEVHVKLDSDLAKDFGLDSVDLIDLLLTAGDHWKLHLELDGLGELAEPTRVSEVVRYIADQIEAARAQLPMARPA